MKRMLLIVTGLIVVSQAQAATTAIRLTEWMYNGLGAGSIGEFIELTNVSGAAVDLTGWSFDDSSRTAGEQSLTALGTLAPGESAIFTDETAANFRSNWGLSGSVKVLGENTNNLGRSDEINLYDAASALVDRLTYNDQGAGNVKGPRTSGTSAWPQTSAVLGTNNASQWGFSVVGDAQNSYASILGEIGNPGTYVPEPATLACLMFGAVLFVRGRRRSA